MLLYPRSSAHLATNCVSRGEIATKAYTTHTDGQTDGRTDVNLYVLKTLGTQVQDKQRYYCVLLVQCLATTSGWVYYMHMCYMYRR